MFQAIVYNGCLYTFTLLAKLEEKSGDARWMRFSEQEYNKLKLNDAEFSYNNNLYDIISSKTEKDTISLLCKVDAKEKDCLEKLIEGFKQTKTKKYISFNFVGDAMHAYDILINRHITDAIKHIYFSSSLQLLHMERTIPPPKA